MYNTKTFVYELKHDFKVFFGANFLTYLNMLYLIFFHLKNAHTLYIYTYIIEMALVLVFFQSF